MERDVLLKSADDALSSFCSFDFYKGSGAGGQKRNKSSSAVRASLTGYDISAYDCTERSQHQNRHNALKKLRMQIALEWRKPFASNNEFTPTRSLSHQEYPLTAAIMLDALEHADGSFAAAAKLLGLSTGQLNKFVGRDALLLQKVRQMTRTQSPCSGEKKEEL